MTTITKNSFSQVSADFAKTWTGAVDALSAMSEAVVTDAKSITVTIANPDGTSTTYNVPSFSALQSQINTLSETVENLLGIDTNALVRSKDGSWSVIYVAQQLKSPDQILIDTAPANFQFKNNTFFDKLMSPSTDIVIDVTELVSDDTREVMVKRLVLNPENDEQIAYINKYYTNQTNINYTEVIIDLYKQGITYFVDDYVDDLPPSFLQFEGTFDILRFEDVATLNADASTAKKRKYFLNTLTYTDVLKSNTSTANTELSLGSKLIVNESVFEVDSVNSAEKSITLFNVSGFDVIRVGGNAMRIWSEKDSVKNVTIPIGYDQYGMVFMKGVDNQSDVAGTEWSPGFGYYSNNLTTITENGETTYKDFYHLRVLDFGAEMLAQAKDKTIYAADGIKLNPVILEAVNFKVELINIHKINNADSNEIKAKASEKVALQSEIGEIDSAISSKKQSLYTTKFNSDAERRGVSNELSSLVTKRSSTSSLLNSITKELAVVAKDSGVITSSPKYRVRGFFEVPEPRWVDRTGMQYPIQFYTYYRYLDLSGNAIDVTQYEYKNSQGKINKASYSKWTKVEGVIRIKEFNQDSGLYEWADIDDNDPDTVNINQVDIPITKGEFVEIKVVTVSEAGWPENPILSDESNVVRISFPDEYNATSEVSSALVSASKEESVIKFQEDLDAKGLDAHLSDSIVVADKYYAHVAENLLSGFFEAGVAQSVYQKMLGMTEEIARLRAIIETVEGELEVFIFNDDGQETKVNNGDVVKIFAGYYTDFVNELTITERKGAIINKEYKIKVTDLQSTPLQLISRYPGGIGESLPLSLGNVDAEYANSRRYDISPIVNNSISKYETNSGSKISSDFYQSQQLKSQWLYVRYTNIGLREDTGNLFEEPNTVDVVDRQFYPVWASVGTPQTFIWNGNLGTSSNSSNTSANPALPGGLLSSFCIHIDHPYLNLPINEEYITMQNPDITIMGLDKNDIPITSSDEALSEFAHSYLFSESSGIDAHKQLNYRKNWENGVWENIITDYNDPLNIVWPIIIEGGNMNVNQYNVETNDDHILSDKYGFTDRDQFLIGKNTCGSYLYITPSTFDQLLVDGTDYRARKEVTKDTPVELPILFQTRFTDYFGDSNSGLGILGGYDPTAPEQILKNLTYKKRIGIDITPENKTIFSFDLEVSMKYTRESLAQKIDSSNITATNTRENLTIDKNTLKNL